MPPPDLPSKPYFVHIFLWFPVLLPKIWVPFPWGDHLACPTASVHDSISSTWGLVTELSPGLAALTAHLSSVPIPHGLLLSGSSSQGTSPSWWPMAGAFQMPPSLLSPLSPCYHFGRKPPVTKVLSAQTFSKGPLFSHREYIQIARRPLRT